MSPQDAKNTLTHLVHNPLHEPHELRADEREALTRNAELSGFRAPSEADLGLAWFAHLRERAGDPVRGAE